MDFRVISAGDVVAIGTNMSQPERSTETTLRKRRIFVLLAKSRKGNCGSLTIAAALNHLFTNDADVSQHH
jgi:hypothetical protein